MKLKQWGFVVFGVCLSGQSFAAADINLRGFASFVGGLTPSSSDALYGYEDKVDFRNDSLIALQVDAALDDKLSATMQFMSRGANDYDPLLEWAYVTYEFNDQLQLSGGKIRIPFYRYSDFIDVRYAYNWLKVPQTVYGFDFPGYDGLSMVYSSQFGGWDSSLQVIYGQFEGDVGETPATLEDLTGFSWTLTWDWLTLRAGYVTSKATIPIEGLEMLGNALEGAGLTDLAGDVRLDGDRGDFWGLALGIDRNNVLFDAEYIQYELEDSLLAETDAYYVALGYRFGKLIPLLTYSESSSEPPGHLSGRVPPALGGSGGFLGQTLAGAVAATEAETKLWDLGVRYDFHHSAAFKLAWTQTDDLATGENGLLRCAIDLVF